MKRAELRTLGSPVTRIKPVVLYVILIFTGVLNLIIIDYSMDAGEKYFGDYSIIELEFAGSLFNANTILEHWNEKGVTQWIYFHLGYDYLFLICYSIFLWLACHASALQLKEFPFFVYLGLIIGWLQPLAGILDVVENQALMHVVMGTTDEFWPKLASWCAPPKFAIAFSGMAYTVLALTIHTYSIALSRIRQAG